MGGICNTKNAGPFAKSQDETIVIAQIEEPQGVEQADAIAAVEGIDVIHRPCRSVCGYGKTDQNSQELRDALAMCHQSRIAAQKPP